MTDLGDALAKAMGANDETGETVMVNYNAGQLKEMMNYILLGDLLAQYGLVNKSDLLMYLQEHGTWRDYVNKKNGGKW